MSDDDWDESKVSWKFSLEFFFFGWFNFAFILLLLTKDMFKAIRSLVQVQDQDRWRQIYPKKWWYVLCSWNSNNNNLRIYLCWKFTHFFKLYHPIPNAALRWKPLILFQQLAKTMVRSWILFKSSGAISKRFQSKFQEKNRKQTWSDGSVRHAKEIFPVFGQNAIIAINHGRCLVSKSRSLRVSLDDDWIFQFFL